MFEGFTVEWRILRLDLAQAKIGMWIFSGCHKIVTSSIWPRRKVPFRETTALSFKIDMTSCSLVAL
jgi:hypothetical protein